MKPSDHTDAVETEIKETKKRSAILLIGPIGAGKSTIAALLSQRLQLPRYSLDDLRFEYYKEIGYSEETAARIQEREGFYGLYQYWKPFEIHALERVLSDHPTNCVIDLGAGHSVYEDDAYFLRAQQALAPFRHVILLLPSPDKADSLRILKERTGGLVSRGFDFDAHFLYHHSNYDLATGIVYTKGKTPEETCHLVFLQMK
jgi:shikimate kinase